MNNFLTFMFLCEAFILDAQIKVEYHFVDTCNNKIILSENVEFELQNTITGKSYYSENSVAEIPRCGEYQLFVDIKNGKYERSYEEIVTIECDSEKIVDTLNVAKIVFEMEPDSESDYSAYYNCDKLCNGYEVDYYPSGNKRYEGNFVNGKSIWIKEYKKDGSSTKYVSRADGKDERIEDFDINDKLLSYMVFEYKKKNKRIVRTYDANGKLVKKEMKIY